MLLTQKNHPFVLGGITSEKDIFVEFVSGFDTQKKDGIISWNEFLDYYTDVSAGIEKDENFEMYMKNVWHVA